MSFVLSISLNFVCHSVGKSTIESISIVQSLTLSAPSLKIAFLDCNILARQFNKLRQAVTAYLNRCLRFGIVIIRRECCAIKQFLERYFLVNKELAVFGVEPFAGVYEFSAFLDEPFSVLKLGSWNTAANVENMPQSCPLKVVRVLNQRESRKVKCKVDDVFQFLSNLQLITREHREELLLLYAADAVQPLSEIVQRVKANLETHQHGQLRRFNFNNPSHGRKMLRIYTNFAEFFREFLFRTRKPYFCFA